METKDYVTINSIQVNHYVFANNAIWQIRRSGDVMPTMEPDAPVMQCYHSFDDAAKFGEIQINYFDAKGSYVGGDKDIVDKLIKMVQENEKA